MWSSNILSLIFCYIMYKTELASQKDSIFPNGEYKSVDTFMLFIDRIQWNFQEILPPIYCQYMTRALDMIFKKYSCSKAIFVVFLCFHKDFWYNLFCISLTGGWWSELAWAVIPARIWQMDAMCKVSRSNVIFICSVCGYLCSV